MYLREKQTEKIKKKFINWKNQKKWKRKRKTQSRKKGGEREGERERERERKKKEKEKEKNTWSRRYIFNIPPASCPDASDIFFLI